MENNNLNQFKIWIGIIIVVIISLGLFIFFKQTLKPTVTLINTLPTPSANVQNIKPTIPPAASSTSEGAQPLSKPMPLKSKIVQ